MTPFMKWAGSKRRLVDKLIPLLPHDFAEWKDVHYVEPFLGSGAFLFSVLERFKNISKVTVNDANANLVDTFKCVRDKPDELIDCLAELSNEYHTSPDKGRFFYDIRNKFNHDGSDTLQYSVMFLFLNRTAFNGVYRVTKAGKFSTSWSHKDKVKIVFDTEIRECSALLQGVDIRCDDFSKLIFSENRPTFYYLDPPYTRTFSKYTSNGFDGTDRDRLDKMLEQIDGNGQFFMLSNSNAQENLSRYAPWNVTTVDVRRSVRQIGIETELVVRNYDS